MATSLNSSRPLSPPKLLFRDIILSSPAKDAGLCGLDKLLMVPLTEYVSSLGNAWVVPAIIIPIFAGCLFRFLQYKRKEDVAFTGDSAAPLRITAARIGSIGFMLFTLLMAFALFANINNTFNIIRAHQGTVASIEKAYGITIPENSDQPDNIPSLYSGMKTQESYPVVFNHNSTLLQGVLDVKDGAATLLVEDESGELVEFEG